MIDLEQRRVLLQQRDQLRARDAELANIIGPARGRANQLESAAQNAFSQVQTAEQMLRSQLRAWDNVPKREPPSPQQKQLEEAIRNLEQQRDSAKQQYARLIDEARTFAAQATEAERERADIPGQLRAIERRLDSV